MAWEETLNETVRTGVAQQELGATAAALGTEYWYQPTATIPTATLNAPTPMDYPPVAGVYRGDPAARNPYQYQGTELGLIHRCSQNNHYFECKHEMYCYCGKTARVDVEKGL